MTDLTTAPQDLTTVRHLLDIISGVPHGVAEADRTAALTELTALIQRTGLNSAVLEMLISGALFHLRSLRDSSFVPRIIQQVKAAGNVSLEDIDTAAFFPERAGKALEKLTDLPEDLLLFFKQAAPKVLAGLSVEELVTILLSAGTPDWLVRIILPDKRLLNILGQAVYAPYNLMRISDCASDTQKTTEFNRTLEQARQALEWVNKCPPEYLPVAVEPCPLEMQEYAVKQLTKELDKFPADKLLTLISLNMLPAWLRQAAEKRFAESAKSAALNTPDRPKRRRRRRSADT
jgi:hypothetical protein